MTKTNKKTVAELSQKASKTTTNKSKKEVNNMNVTLKDFLIEEESPVQFETMLVLDARIRSYGRNEFFRVMKGYDYPRMRAFRDWDDNAFYPVSAGFLKERKLKADTYAFVPCVNRDGEVFFAYFNVSKLYPGSFDRILKDIFNDAKESWVKIDYDREHRIPVATKALNQNVEPEWPEDISTLLCDAVSKIAINDLSHPYMVKTLGC